MPTGIYPRTKPPKAPLEQLVSLYFDKKLSTTEIGKQTGYNCSQISRILRDNGYMLRTISESKKIQGSHILTSSQVIEIKRLYSEEYLSIYKIGKILNIYPGTVFYQLKKEGLIRNRQEWWDLIKQGRIGRFYTPFAETGENHSNWQGGISFLPYPIEFNSKLKWKVKKRDNYLCQLCGEANIKKLGIHHIDYDKRNLNLNNLITLCLSCNSIVNWDREYWKDFLKIGTEK